MNYVSRLKYFSCQKCRIIISLGVVSSRLPFRGKKKKSWQKCEFCFAVWAVLMISYQNQNPGSWCKWKDTLIYPHRWILESFDLILAGTGRTRVRKSTDNFLGGSQYVRDRGNPLAKHRINRFLFFFLITTLLDSQTDFFFFLTTTLLDSVEIWTLGRQRRTFQKILCFPNYFSLQENAILIPGKVQVHSIWG